MSILVDKNTRVVVQGISLRQSGMKLTYEGWDRNWMGRPSPECRSRLTFDRSPVRESRTPGSAREAGGNSCSYRDRRGVPASADRDATLR